MKKFNHILVATLIALMGWSCSDEEMLGSGEAALNINLALPSPQHQPASRATYEGSDEEYRINDLRVIAFPQNGKGTLINKAITLPQAGEVAMQTRISDIRPGDYRVYIVANMGEQLKSVETETALREVIINYSQNGSPALPKAGNLPMVYEPSSNLTVGTTTETQLSASLAFACVKVALNVVFDKSDPVTSAAYGTNGLRISAITANKMSTSQTLLNTQRRDIATFNTTLPLGKHYASYTITNSNATVDDADVVENFGGEGTPSNVNGKWCYHQIIYLPERYVSDNANQTTLTLDGELFDNSGSTQATNRFTINLGHEVSGKLALPRDTYYEVIGTVHSLGTISLATTMSIKPWGQVAIDASMRHTLLSVDRTKCAVSSLEPTVVNYSSSASNVEFECQAPYIQGYPVIVADHDAAHSRFTLKVNPAIQIAQLTAAQQKGTVMVKLKANNIVKYIDVEYDIQPFFNIEEREHLIIWGEQLTKVTTITTNLGGVRAPWSLPHTITSGSAQASISITKVSEGVYHLTITCTKDPGTTTPVMFTIGPDSDTFYGNFAQEMTATLKPQPNKYRIYMRAINDRLNGSYPGDGTLASILTENDNPGAGNTSNNWKDGWSDNDQMNGNRHRLYLYYQYGESGGTDQIPEENVWRFSGSFPGHEMIGDSQNPGWYYKDYALTATGVNSSGKPARGIVPGETLLIFSSNWDTDKGYTRHRFTHHMDPGITLFNFEDLEGWYLYDPTSDPYYRIYDEKPVIVDVTYSVYYKGTISKWENTYGVAGEDVSSRYTISSTNITRTSVGNGWYKHTFTLKAPKGEYEKAIQLVLSGTSTKPVLFGGNSWTVGYYDGSWHYGKPSGVSN